MKLITGSNDYYFLVLLQFIKQYISLNLDGTLIIYDLGLNENNLTQLYENITANIIVKKFDYNQYPDHVNLYKYNGLYCSYAFKPICIYNECIINPECPTIWLDCGNIFSSYSINKILESIDKYGFYCPVGNYERSIESVELNHPTTMKLIGLTEYEHHNNLQTRHACVCGIKYNTDASKYIIDNWYKYSLQKDIIMPYGSSRNNHRQDQSILSGLMFLWEKNNYIFDKNNYNISRCNINVMVDSEYTPYKLVGKTGIQYAIIYTLTLEDAIDVYCKRKNMDKDFFLSQYNVLQC